MKKLGLIFTCCILLLCHSYSQELSYTRYDTKDGLAGSLTYCITLDKDGFLWIGTENGLSRFDGTHFKNFTTSDGLPDNEILELFTDSRGRVWMAPFKNAVCYFYKGKIYTNENDSTLAKIKIFTNISRIAEDKDGNILMSDYSLSRLYFISAKGDAKIIDHFEGEPIKNLTTISVTSEGDFMILKNDSLYRYAMNKLSFITKLESSSLYREVTINKNFLVRRISTKEITITNAGTNNSMSIPFPHLFIKTVIINDSMFAFCKQDGIDIYNANYLTQHNYLEGKPVTATVVDQEGSLWFTTLGQGIYRLNSSVIKNQQLFHSNQAKYAITSFVKQNSRLFAGTQVNEMFELGVTPDKGIITKKIFLDDAESTSDIIDMRVLDNGDKIYFGSSNVIKKRGGKAIKGLVISFKCVADINKKQLAMGTSRGAFIFDPYTYKTTDTLWKQRVTAIYYRSDSFLIGALDGLYLVKRDKSSKYLGTNEPLLRIRIAAIKEAPDGQLWIATYGNGVLAYKNNKVVAHLTQATGLTSNICRTIFVDSANLWIGTDKGLNKVNFANGSYQVTKYGLSDGLLSNTINAIFVEGEFVFVGTREGLNYFEKSKINLGSVCNLRLTSLMAGGNNLPLDTSNFTLPHHLGNIRIDFAGISYRSAGDISYQYRLLGLDTNWKTTRETFLSYPTLPSGKYELQLQAINKFGVSSDLLVLPFSIEKTFLEKTWFRILVVALIAGLFWMLLTLRIKFIRKQEKEKSQVEDHIRELEQLALKSQMNPHFIFNSLNSIQQYVMDKDIEGANKFISGFSKLMRQTLHFSSKSTINLADETSYLSNYLQLEKDRLEDVFTYQVTINENIIPYDHFIPPMILQPFVENAVRHGVRHKTDNSGNISINFTECDHYLVCTIEDNGIGRKVSQQLKGLTNIEYQSRGMSLTSERIKALNEKSVLKIELAIEDLLDKEDQPAGTRITVKFPVMEI